MATTSPTLGRTERIDYAEILPHRTKLLILAGVLLSLFLSALDQTIVSTALPAIVRDFNGIDLVSWVSTGYLLASTAMVPIYGKLSDLYGRKYVLLWGIVVFLIGSMLCGIASSMIQLVLYRVVQGIGAAALTSTAFAIPADLFAPAERPKYMGLFGSVFGLSSVVGPFLGGLLTDSLSWHWVFFVNLPLGLIALGFVITKMPRLASGIRAPIDWLGTVLLILAVVPFMLGLTLDKTLYPWTSPLILGMFGVALVSLIAFLVVELRVPSPVISLGLFRNRTFAVGVVASMLNGAAFCGALLFLSLFMVNVLGLTATQAGTAQIPLMLAFVLSSNISSLLVQRVGRYKPFMLVGFVVMIIGFILMSRINVNSSQWDVTWRMFVVGFGLGPALPLLNLAMQNAVSFQQIGAATANRQFFQQLGQAIGGAVFGVILTTTLTTQLQQNLTPVVQQLPASAQARFDPSQFRSSVAASEGAGGGTDISGQIAAETTAQFNEQRKLVEAAIGQGDTTARATLLASPELPAQLRQVLESNTTANPQLLAQITPVLDQAEQQAREGAQQLGGQIEGAVKESFATSIASIYKYAIFLAVAALLVILFGLPELPLRKTNKSEALPVME